MTKPPDSWHFEPPPRDDYQGPPPYDPVWRYTPPGDQVLPTRVLAVVPDYIVLLHGAFRSDADLVVLAEVMTTVQPVDLMAIPMHPSEQPWDTSARPIEIALASPDPGIAVAATSGTWTAGAFNRSVQAEIRFEGAGRLLDTRRVQLDVVLTIAPLQLTVREPLI